MTEEIRDKRFRDYQIIFFKLIDLLSLPLFQKNKNGQNTLETAFSHRNKEIHEIFDGYNWANSNLGSHELSERHILWRQIIQTKLEETPLAQGVLRGDPEAFRKALEELYSGPARNFFTVLHSRTEEGDTLFHLVAKAQSHQEEFAREIEKLIELVIPVLVRELYVDGEDDLTSLAVKRTRPKKRFRRLYSGILFLFLGASSAMGPFSSDHYALGTEMNAVAGEELRQCYSAFKERQ